MTAAGPIMQLAADGDGGTVLARDVEIAADLFQMPRMDQRTDLGCGIQRMANLQRLHARRKLLDETLGNARLDQKPRRRGAALAIERIDHEHDGVERAVEIG